MVPPQGLRPLKAHEILEGSLYGLLLEWKYMRLEPVRRFICGEGREEDESIA